MTTADTPTRCAAILVAGGAGMRADPDGAAVPKQFRLLVGRPVIVHALAPFLSHPEIGAVQVVVRPGTEQLFKEAVPPHPRLRAAVAGGARRQDSVRLGLEALADLSPERVLIHDAVRPFASRDIIDRVLLALDTWAGAVPGVAVADTLKRAASEGRVAETVDRSNLVGVQTPQGFHFPAILEAHRRAAKLDCEFTDDAAVAEWASIEVALVEGAASNRKLTTQEDFIMAETLLASSRETRTGTGFDVHRFGPGDHVTLCGVEIRHDRGLVGHSDADVGLHALTDALLGAIAEGDIGSHFPPSDPQWKDAASRAFLARARDLVSARGGSIVNVDVTLICEAPRIGAYRHAMRARIAEALKIPEDRVAVKATTSEGLGFAGRREGIAAQALATVSLPSGDGSG